MDGGPIYFLVPLKHTQPSWALAALNMVNLEKGTTLKHGKYILLLRHSLIFFLVPFLIL